MKKNSEHGQVSWVDIISSNPEETVDFYTRVFAYEHSEMTMPESDTYHVLKIKNGAKGSIGVLGVTAISKEAKEMGLSHQMYNNFIVSNIEETVLDVKKAGGTVLNRIDYPNNSGTMLVCRDPWGNSFTAVVFNSEANMPKKNFTQAAGQQSYFELTTSHDISEVADFYSAVFAYESREAPPNPALSERKIIQLRDLNGKDTVGLITSHPGGDTHELIGAHYMKNYFSVSDLAASNKAITASGGQLLLESIKGAQFSIAGDYSVAVDPYGTVFSPIVWNS